jgi:hypothetical protein
METLTDSVYGQTAITLTYNVRATLSVVLVSVGCPPTARRGLVGTSSGRPYHRVVVCGVICATDVLRVLSDSDGYASRVSVYTRVGSRRRRGQRLSSIATEEPPIGEGDSE